MPSKRAFQRDGKKLHISPHKPEAFLFKENAFQAKKKKHPGIDLEEKENQDN